MSFIDMMANAETNCTANGAIQYVTAGSKLVDINFAVPELRAKAQQGSTDPYLMFMEAYHEDKEYALRWLLFLRNVRGGLGERESFRNIMLNLCDRESKLACAIAHKVDLAEYGRWDDVVYLACHTGNMQVRKILMEKIKARLKMDVEAEAAGMAVSLLGKWLPSENASAAKTREMAHALRAALGMNSAAYRKMLSRLRKKINIVEANLCAKTYEKINYEQVPSLANVRYREAFLRNDRERRLAYLEGVKAGTKKMNAGAMFIHDIVNRYSDGWRVASEIDDTLELAWKNVGREETYSDVLIVRDGSGSMTCRVDNKTNTTCLDVATALTLYCAEQNQGAFHNKFISFSSRPQVEDVSAFSTLRDKLDYCYQKDECSTTNVEGVFDLILQTAVKEHIPQEEMPQKVVVISDMQFDDAMDESTEDAALFETIGKKYAAAGYKLPGLVFWNCSAYGSRGVPLQQNDNGLVLMSGFSTDLLRFITAGEYSPLDTLKKILGDSVYDVAKSVAEAA